MAATAAHTASGTKTGRITMRKIIKPCKGGPIYPVDELIAGMSVTLSTDELRALEAPDQPHPVLGIE